MHTVHLYVDRAFFLSACLSVWCQESRRSTPLHATSLAADGRVKLSTHKQAAGEATQAVSSRIFRVGESFPSRRESVICLIVKIFSYVGREEK